MISKTQNNTPSFTGKFDIKVKNLIRPEARLRNFLNRYPGIKDSLQRLEKDTVELLPKEDVVRYEAKIHAGGYGLRTVNKACCPYCPPKYSTSIVRQPMWEAATLHYEPGPESKKLGMEPITLPKSTEGRTSPDMNDIQWFAQDLANKIKKLSNPQKA